MNNSFSELVKELNKKGSVNMPKKPTKPFEKKDKKLVFKEAKKVKFDKKPMKKGKY